MYIHTFGLLYVNGYQHLASHFLLKIFIYNLRSIQNTGYQALTQLGTMLSLLSQVLQKKDYSSVRVCIEMVSIMFLMHACI